MESLLVNSLIQQVQSEMDTYSWALNRTIINVINDIMWVSAINAAAHRLGSPKDLLDCPCSGKIKLVSALPQENFEERIENSPLHTPQLSIPPSLWGLQAVATGFTRGQQAT